MKNLLGIVILGGFLYVVMGGSTPSFTHYLGGNEISYDDRTVDDDDVFVGIHVTYDENGQRRVTGVSHWGALLSSDMRAGIFQRDQSVQRSYVAQAERESVSKALPCETVFVDIDDVDARDAIDLLGDLCIVGGMGADKFYAHNHIRRGSVAKIVVGTLLYVYEGDASVIPVGVRSVYEDAPLHMQGYLVQLDERGLLDNIARDGDVFGVDDIMTKNDITLFLEDVIASIPAEVQVSDTIRMPLHDDYVTRGMFARMVVDALQLHRRVQRNVIVMN